DPRVHSAEGQAWDQSDADPSGYESLDRLVVVALERHPRFKASRQARAHDVAGTGTALRSLYPVLIAQVTEAECGLRGEWMGGGQRDVHRVLEQRDRT